MTQKMTNRLTIELRRLAFENHGRCVSCGYCFREGDTSHLGYGHDGVTLYVCDNCSHILKETSARQYFMPHPYDVPEPTSKLWRYMDFTKYVSLLSTRGLFFARTDCFPDTFEGAKGLKKNKVRWDDHFLNFFCSAIKNPPEGQKCGLSDKEVEAEAKRLLNELELGGTASKKRTFISCWHESEHESEAMWRLYSNFLPSAIAVRSSYQSLYLSLGRNPSVKIGRIRYIDLQKSFAGVNDAFWRKRKSFEYEREVRALIMDLECEALGKIMPCDLTTLIEEVFVSPQASVWFVSLVNDVNDKFGLHVKVSPSELLEEPFF